jgi:hypothetical protein
MDYEKLSNYFPNQLKSIRIIESSKNETITEEEIVFSSILKKSIIQTCSHSFLNDNLLHTKILSGPAKNSQMDLKFKSTDIGTTVNASIDLKLSLKAKILLPFIKKGYKMLITSILYKISTEILQMHATKNKINE